MLLPENRRLLGDFKSMPRPNAADMPTFTNKFIVDELNYNKGELEKTHTDMLLMLTNEQRCVHDKIMESVGSNDGGFFFLYGYGGGRIMHSTPTVPIKINEASSLTMEKNSPRVDLVRAATLIIWDEAPIMLTVNMRLGSSSVPAKQEEIDNFGKWILSIEDGNDASDENGELKVEIPDDFLISDTTNPLMSLIDFVYPDLNDNLGDPLFFQERGILAPTIDSVEHVNEYMMSLIPGEEKEYLSFDYVCRSGENYDVQSELFTTEFLNGIKSSETPNHRLKLRMRCPVMLMRNINQANGLCNGTRLAVTHLGKSTIAATVITEKRAGTRVFIPSMNLIANDPGLPFKFRWSIFISSEIYLPKPVITHGQLYVAVSRVTSRKGLKLLILDEDHNVCKETTNVVYREVF
ncbi:PIF1-like helicase [Medicago truncatula]|uniref:ATP-dependent DNA helicase n=1 Tax=Medicago truncatula TaxID=3880 RepID=G7I7D4_MEDTR|nr:PIF1-like helicase [Medicago truncatula]